MKRCTPFLFLLTVCFIHAAALPPNPCNLMIAPGTLAENGSVLLWDKQPGTNNGLYQILVNDEPSVQS